MNFKEEINKTGLKKKAIAEKLGISKVYLSYLLNGKRPFTPELEDRLKNILK